jgi:hypothetical protein
MRKNLKVTITILFVVGLLISMVSMLVSTSIAADGISQPNSFIEYSNAYVTAVVNVPSISNITRMTIAAMHQYRSSTIDNYEVLAFQLSSSLTTGTASATITTNFNAEDINLRKAYRNGTSYYTEIDGNVTINNLLRVTANELRVVKTGNRVTIDFEPKTPVVVTLPRAVFPAANFSATWTVPAFHMDLDVNGTFALGNSSSVTASGWREYNEYVSSNANFTFNCPSWSNYSTSGSLGGTVRSYNVHRGQGPGTPISPTNLTRRAVFMKDVALAPFNIPNSGNITRLTINPARSEEGIPRFPALDALFLTLSAAGFSGSVEVIFYAGIDEASLKDIRGLRNGTATYTEIDGNIIINNIFNVSANDLKIQSNGTRLTCDFNPTTPVAITLPAAQFPRANFSTTWTVPAFNIEFNVAASSFRGVSNDNITNTSGWTETLGYLSYAASVNCTIPSLSFAYTGSGSLFPYMVGIFSSPLEPRAPTASTFTSVTVLPGWTWYFFVHSNGGLGQYTYQWYEGTTLLQGQTSMVLPVTKNMPGTYTFHCKVIDAEGSSVNSNAVTLTVR